MLGPPTDVVFHVVFDTEEMNTGFLCPSLLVLFVNSQLYLSLHWRIFEVAHWQVWRRYNLACELLFFPELKQERWFREQLSEPAASCHQLTRQSGCSAGCKWCHCPEWLSAVLSVIATKKAWGRSPLCRSSFLNSEECSSFSGAHAVPHVIWFGSKLLCSCIFCKLRNEKPQFKSFSRAMHY